MSSPGHYRWDVEFLALFDRCVAKYRGGDTDFSRYYSAGDSAFLTSIGYKPREFFDFVEDFCEYDGDPSPGTALLIAAARRDYLLTVQHGTTSTAVLDPASLPPKDGTSLGGIRWLARIVVKARAKLRGELHPDIMYGCGGDRQFLSGHNIHMADFLRAAWAAGDDDAKLLEWFNAMKK
ncbi:MAG TPA: DUF5069 domain-containing protein [Verrucomicrobiales bacterium]|nr:DUF5069 domain-containing protein [Verrucomicrobiales bacterium]